MKGPKLSFVSFVIITVTVQGYAHDAWLAAQWNANKTQVLISALIAEKFPDGEAIRDWSRFSDPVAHFLGRGRMTLTGDPSDSAILGMVSPAPSIIVTTAVKQREIKFKRDLAERYLMEEIGLTKEETVHYLTPGVPEFQETYTRYLKILVSVGGKSPSPKDSAVGLPLELKLLSWEEGVQGQAVVRFHVFDNGKVIANAPVRVLQEGKTTIVRTDSQGEARAEVDDGLPVLLAFIKVIKISDHQLNSLWTNLAIYRLEE